MTKHERDIKKWKDIIGKANSSGITIRQWCVENNVTRGQYYYWHKLVAEDNLREENPGNDDGAIQFPVVTEIRITDQKPASMPVFEAQIMLLINEYQVFIGQAASRDAFQMVMEVIGKC